MLDDDFAALLSLAEQQNAFVSGTAQQAAFTTGVGFVRAEVAANQAQAAQQFAAYTFATPTGVIEAVSAAGRLAVYTAVRAGIAGL